MQLPAEQFLEFDQQGTPALQDAAIKVANAKQWQDKYRLLMQLGKLLPAIDDAAKTEDALVDGCESAAWLFHFPLGDLHLFLADSDARIVKGLIVLLLAATNGKTAEEIHAFDASAYFAELGLAGQLSPSRSNGLYALAAQIQRFAQ